MTLPAAAPSSFSFRSSAACLAAAPLLALCSSALAAGDADVGLALYKARCSACHSLDYNGVGPAHRGVFERGAALAPGFAYSDALKSYDGLSEEYAHQVVDHAIEYVRENVHTNGLENFWSLLKRGINGTYVSVEPYHLFRYVDEQAFRFNNREDRTDFDRFKLLLSGIVGKRLTYDALIGSGKELETATC